MQLADALVTTLRDLGVAHLFGVSGANIEHLHDAVHRLGDGRLRSVLAKTETGAAFMADATARVHGRLGVCCATSGGGMMNLAVGIAESHAEALPVLAIVGQVPRKLQGRGGFQDASGTASTIDAVAMFRAIAKHVAVIDDPSRFWQHLHDALAACLSARTGPAVLLVPRDVFAEEVPERPAHFPQELREFVRHFSPLDVSPVVLALREAARPVLLWGPEVARAGAARELAQFARNLGLPVMTTMADAAAFPHDDPLFLGVVGAAGHPSAHAYLASRADLILCVGSSLGSMVRGPFESALSRIRSFALTGDATCLRHASDGRTQVLELDLLEGVRALSRAVRKRPFRVPPPGAYEHTRYVPTSVEARGEGLGCSEALDTLQCFLPARGHVVFDAGNCAATAIHRLSMHGGLCTTIALGMGGMGYALAAAVGAQLGASEDARTLALVGDGAFMMLGFEVHTAVELGLPILFVVFNDGKHGMCVTRQRLLFGARFEATRYGALDVAGVARGLGDEEALWVGRADSPSALRGLLAAYDALPRARPGVLEIVLTREEVPPFAPFLPRDAETFVVPTRASGHAA